MVSEKVSVDKGEQLRNYELVLVINPEITDEQFEATLDSVSRFIAGKGGAISETEKWGKRKLAYPIRHFSEGSYVLTKLQLKPASSKELEANLQISEGVLRHLLVRLDE